MDEFLSIGDAHSFMSQPAATEPVADTAPAAEVAAKPTLATDYKGAAEAPALVPPPMYTPNHKFKAQGKDLEFDDWAKAASKDAETEKKIRDMHEKAYGLDSVKQSRQALQSELSATQEKLASTDRAIDTIAEYAKVKDWDSFYESLNIPKNDVLKYALELVKREQLPPEQREQWEASRQSQQELKNLQAQNAQMHAEKEQHQVDQRSGELEAEISKTGNSDIAEAYNNGMQDSNAFRNFVIRIGQAYATQGQDISAEQAVNEATRQLRAAQSQTRQEPTAQQGKNVVASSKKPVLPNIQGRGTSAVKSSVRSLDDLRAKSRELSSYT